ncbi:MAG: SDR family NAD(P)-dependent oxidoreductase [Candidatus Rokubacteria bacterium]|nr:SDR family NAD(P)-dependent oxidoreductase [Candidatus Rokubacteria bacterium]
MTAFDGRIVFITGASSGIGAELAREFAREGAAVALAARRVDRLHAVAADVAKLGRRATALACDVTRDGDLERAVAETRVALGPIDVAVANAGFGVVGPVARLTLDDFRRQFETNVFGVLRTVYATLPDLERTRGTLVLIGSVSGHIGVPGTAPYAMSKFAVRGLAQSLRHELGPSGVAVVLVSPGYVVSEIHQVDNTGVYHAETAAVVPDWLRMPTAKAARQIVRATAARRQETVITGHGKAVVLFQRHVPWLVSAVIRRFGVRGRPQAGKSPA